MGTLVLVMVEVVVSMSCAARIICSMKNGMRERVLRSRGNQSSRVFEAE